MGGSKQTQTTTQTKDPWGPTQGVLGDIVSRVRDFQGDSSLFTPTYSGATKDSAGQLEALGRGTNTQQGYLPSIVSGMGDGFKTGLDTLTKTANGGMLAGGGNPYLDSVLNTSKQRAADTVNQQFAGAGRFGANASNTGVLADRLGSIETNARMEDYNNERTRQLNAAGILQGMGTQGAGLATQLDNANVGQAGLLGQAGQMYDTMDNAKRTAPLAATQWAAGLATPIAGLGGTQSGTQTTTTPMNIPGMVAGGVMSGLGLMGTPNFFGNVGNNAKAIGGWFS